MKQRKGVAGSPGRRVLALFVTLSCLAAASGSVVEELRVYISADMEGITGVASRTQISPEGREYEKYRSIMTADVNAAIEGALAAGATDIVVSDSHGRGENLKLEELDAAAKLVRSFPRALDMMHGIDGSFDAALFVGYHASAGTRDAVLAHTGNSRISAFHVNGVNLPEGGVSAIVAGHFGVPVVMISGDRAAIEEMQNLVGDIESAQVKTGNGVTSASVEHPIKTRDLIRRSAELGILRRADIRPYKIDLPAIVEVSFFRTTDAEVVSLLPGAERTDANRIRFEVENAISVVKLFNALMYIQTSDI